MGLTIHKERITPSIAQALTALCPFGAIEYQKGVLSISGGCKNCKVCVHKGPAGAITWEDMPVQTIDARDEWGGVAVYAELRAAGIHPVTLELIGKAKELAKVTGQPVVAVLIGDNTEAAAKELLHYSVDRVYVYSSPAFSTFTVGPYANAFYDFIEKVKPSSVLVGATNLGRTLAPKVAARAHTGLTADCTALEMKANTDLMQIRPAFGGNIMAQIVTPRTRPQFCTVRYKVFSAPERSALEKGEIVHMPVAPALLTGRTEVLHVEGKPAEVDLSDAEIIIACGRGFQKAQDLSMARELAELLHAQLACTRPLVESGWMDAKRQIGLSGRTVKPKLILTLGISGSVQFAAGMKNSDWIIAINRDRSAGIFGIAHVGIVGDLYEIVPRLIERIREEKRHV